ncbi:ras-related and estrogen-regulated growth inhibitor-like protein [Leucoraja erinacea]|uniref:ras-related and estrogen-regulated growth inhibitor-like protein n=1 Tax=Leucoraja erinaceus TaxID=7782 RepID=UPI002453D55E|nr:ras-related and estrogen-regulated growth inhibitor-like protein [Leucoraja erinacea]
MWADLKIKAANGSVHSLHEREALALTTIPPPSRMEANVVMLGADNVGKSALTVRFLTRRFIGEYGDIESVYNHNVTVAGRHVAFNIWDSPFAQDRLNSSCGKEKQIQWADGFVLVYSICDRASFNIVRQQIQLIKSMKDYPSTERAPIIIVGNKRDLCHCRTVSSEEGRLLALATHCGFCEISTAETYHGVLVAFHSLVDRIKESKMLTVRKPAGIKGIVRSMSAVFTRRRTDSL